MELRVGPMLRVANRPRRHMIERRADDIAADHVLASAASTCERVVFNFRYRPLRRRDVGANQPAIVADERLDTYGFRGAEDAVPARGVLAGTNGGGNEDRAGTRVNALQKGGEILAAHFPREPQAGGAPPDPAPDAAP